MVRHAARSVFCRGGKRFPPLRPVLTQAAMPCMLAGMAIRMREWATLAAPRAAVAIPTQGIRESAAAWSALGDAVGQAGRSAAAAMREHEQAQQEQQAALRRVERAGALSAFHERLNRVFDETSAALQESEVKDWHYAWQQHSAPAVQEALAELPPELRGVGAQLAAQRSAAAAQQAQRNADLQGIARARSQWQMQLESAVQNGDAETAARWLEEGKGIFVPPAELEQRKENALSRCGLNRWQQRLAESPAEALADLQAAEADLPAAVEDRKVLEESRAAAQVQLQRRWSQEFSAAVLAGREPDTAALQQARQLHLLPEPPQEPPALQCCNWRQRIDEYDAEDADALRLQLAVAPLPLRERRALLRRLDAAGSVPRTQRTAVGGALMDLYRAGRFGCTGDAESLQYLRDLQEEALTRMQAQKPQEVEAWVDSLRRREETWICFAE